MSDEPKFSRDPKVRERSNEPFNPAYDFDIKSDPRARFIDRRVRPADSENGLLQFFGGLGLFAVGTWMLFDRVRVTMGVSGMGMFGMGFGGGPHIGPALLPFAAGIIVFFIQGSTKLGWGLVAGGIGFLIWEILTNLTMHFMPTTLPTVLFIVGLMAAGIGLIARSLRGTDPK